MSNTTLVYHVRSRYRCLYSCGRVAERRTSVCGDGEREELKLRVPPYNTMMQLYTTTKSNRDRALFYYDKMKQANIAPNSFSL